MNHKDLIAIDIHTHAEVSCWNPFDNYGEEYDRAADKFLAAIAVLPSMRRWPITAREKLVW